MGEDMALEYLQRAWDFERGARCIINSFDCDRVRYAPPLHLIAHGFELLFKAEIIDSGADFKVLRRFGHDLEAMWDSSDVESLKKASGPAAERAVKNAKTKERYRGQHFPANPKENFDEQLRYLSKLHSADMDYALRYPSTSDTVVNVPPFMDDVLEALINDSLDRSGRTLPRR